MVAVIIADDDIRDAYATALTSTNFWLHDVEMALLVDVLPTVDVIVVLRDRPVMTEDLAELYEAWVFVAARALLEPVDARLAVVIVHATDNHYSQIAIVQ
jgi:hypothetical protein